MSPSSAKNKYLCGPAKMLKLLAGKVENMHFTYVLRCIDLKRNRRKFYIGTTENMQTRIRAHKTKSVETTKSFDKVELVYYEACLSKTDAIRRENQLKTGFGRGYIKRRLEDYLKDVKQM